MNEAQFRRRAGEMGYGDCLFKDFAAHMDGPLHTRDLSVMLLVVSGTLTLAYENGATTYRPGETCELAAGVLHAERNGSDEVRVLSGKKHPSRR